MSAPARPGIDVIGDVHGELPALEALGRELGYRVDDGWSHPERRVPCFLGDLIDGGAHGLEVGELVLRLCLARRGFCLMGNHEYNLVAWRAGLPGYHRPKRSGAATAEDVGRRPARWAPVLAFFRALPIGVALPDLRIIHACWHAASLARVEPVLGRPERRPASGGDAFDALDLGVVLRSPFALDAPVERARLLAGLPGVPADRSEVVPHEALLKGHEVEAAQPFTDHLGQIAARTRAAWWLDGLDQVRHDRPQVFGHYWNLPPLDEERLTPPGPAGDPTLRAWAEAHARRVPERGSAPMTGSLACVDFQGVSRGTGRACVGALRWPERRIAWACAPRTGLDGDEG